MPPAGYPAFLQYLQSGRVSGSSMNNWSGASRTHRPDRGRQQGAVEGFSYSVSHDLRSPLRAIDGFSQILMTEYAPGLEGEPRRCLQRISENTRKMGRLIDVLLRFSRLGRQAMDSRPVAMADLVRQCLDELAAEREGRRVEIALGELPPFRADATLLKQVWLNLLANALKFTRQARPGSGRGRQLLPGRRGRLLRAG